MDEVATTEPKENIETEAMEAVVKVETVVKAEPNEEKSQMDTSDGPNIEKAEADAANGKPTTGTNVNGDLDDKIIRQVEYYFGDYNLPRDKFLKEIMGLDDGWIPIATMLKFARLSQLTKSPAVIFAALKKSNSGLMEVNETTSKIRRSKDKPIPVESEEYLAEVKARTIYCKGLPKEGMTIDKLLEFFKSFPTVLNIKMRYYKTKDDMAKFKGSITVTFATRDEAAKFISLESVKYNDYTLQRQWSAEWEMEKEHEFEERKKRKEKREKNTDENGNGHKGDDKESVKNEKIVLSRGTVLKLVNLPSGMDRDVIKQAFSTYPADIAHVEITPESTAFVRLRGENDGKLVLDKLTDKKISIKDSSVEVSLLEGEEEETYLKKAEENVNNRVNMGGRGGFRRGQNKKEVDRYKQKGSHPQRQTESFLDMHDLLGAGCSVKVPGSSGPGKGWVDHRPPNTLQTDTVFQPQMNRAKSITKLVDSKTITHPNVSKYVLTTQEQDSSGEINTNMYKFDVLKTLFGGAQVVLQDVETLRQSAF